MMDSRAPHNGQTARSRLSLLPRLASTCRWVDVLIAVVLICVLSLTAAAQPSITLTLARSIEMAQLNSPATRSARLSYDESSWNYQAHRAQYLPTLMIAGNAPGLERSVQDIITDDGSVAYVQRNSTFARSALTVSQPVPFTGGHISFSTGLSRLENTAAGTDFTQWSSTPLVVRVTQPILQFNEMKWSRRTEPLRYRIARRALVEDLEGVAVDVTNLFFAVYMASLDVEIASANAAVNDSIFILSQGRFEIGKIAENDLLQSELALLNAQSERSQAVIRLEEAEQDLKLALELPSDTRLAVAPPTTVPEVNVDPQTAVARARENRGVFPELELQALEAERELVRAKRQSGFSANLTASYGLNQSSGTFGGVYDRPLSQQQFTLNFQMPIVQWGLRKAEVEAAAARLQQIEVDADVRRKELDKEVYFEAVQLRQLQQQVRIAGKADTVAVRRFDVAKNRYLIGKIDITELFNAQREKDVARRGYAGALRQFWVSYFRLRSLTVYDFVRGARIEVPEW